MFINAFKNNYESFSLKTKPWISLDLVKSTENVINLANCSNVNPSTLTLNNITTTSGPSFANQLKELRQNTTGNKYLNVTENRKLSGK